MKTEQPKLETNFKFTLISGRKTHLDGVWEGESDDIAGVDAGREEKRGGLINKLIQSSVGEIEFSRDRKRTAGGELLSLLLQQTS